MEFLIYLDVCCLNRPFDDRMLRLAARHSAMLYQVRLNTYNTCRLGFVPQPNMNSKLVLGFTYFQPNLHS
jgi:hypothetical protein